MTVRPFLVTPLPPVQMFFCNVEDNVRLMRGRPATLVGELQPMNRSRRPLALYTSAIWNSYSTTRTPVPLIASPLRSISARLASARS